MGSTLACIRFTIEVDTEDLEPSRVITKIHGRVFQCDDEGEIEIAYGSLMAYLVLTGRAINERVDLFDAMDSIDATVYECYEAVFEPESDEWREAIRNFYDGGVLSRDVLFIASIELEEAFRKKGIGAEVVRETIATFGSHCGLVVCKPFPLQYSNWGDEEHAEMRKALGFEEQRVKAFDGVSRFWRKCGFVRLPQSEFFAYSPELSRQPNSEQSKITVIRVPRGRRKLPSPPKNTTS